MWRAVVPGWGQAYNGRPLKAVIFAAGRLYLAGAAVYNHREAEDFEQQALDSDDPEEAAKLWQQRNRALDKREDFIWWSVFALAFSMLEAYVDAALMDFGPEFDELDKPPSEGVSFHLGYRHRF